MVWHLSEVEESLDLVKIVDPDKVHAIGLVLELHELMEGAFADQRCSPVEPSPPVFIVVELVRVLEVQRQPLEGGTRLAINFDSPSEEPFSHQAEVDLDYL
mmetsp:Transcript_5340/g.7150  ORF Transcript_5340/g.7150 Transcript_5340/m.7150 type:complete len:101 (+) Transcript_5340:806-1108(+)